MARAMQHWLISAGFLMLCMGLVLPAAAQVDSNVPGEGQQAYLGLGVAPVPEPLVAHINEVAGEGRGVMIAEVKQGSPAEKAGLRRYDVVIRYDDQDIYSPEQFVKLVRNDTPGRTVTLQVVRGGKIVELKATLGGIATQPRVRGQLAERVPWLQRWPVPREWFGVLPGLGGSTARQEGQAARGDQGQASAEQERSGTSEGEEQRSGGPSESPWEKFESMTVTKLDNNRYKVEINYIDANDKQVHREFVGTREQIKKAIKADEDLPADEREHLLRALDMQEQPPTLLFPNLELLERELFNWPNLLF